jgi:hypothetical protein
MNQENQLRQLIRESIQEYIREVEASGNIAAQEAKIRACEEAIALREKKANLEGIDETMHEMIDSNKINEIKKEIKELQKYKSKAEKVLDKMKMKSEGKTTKKMEDEGMEEEGMVDEVNLDEYTDDPAAGPQLETEQVYEMLLMQKRAGIISETEYKAKVEEAKKKMTAAQKEKKEDIVKGMKKSKSFGKSKDEKSKMYATATKLATKKNKSLKEEVQALFEDDTLNEDILELKQMSKQLYSFLKQKGFSPLLQSKLETGKSSKTGDGENIAQIIVSDKPDERVTVAVSAPSVAKAMVGGGDDWDHKATQKFGQNITSNAMNASGNWFKNPEIIKYVDGLGNEILKQIFAKYPNMEYSFSQQDGFWYILQFRFKKTTKGGTANPNQRPNAPKPTA